MGMSVSPWLPGLEQCVMLRPAYAVEYDYLPAHQCRQGLALVHFSAQPEPFLTQSKP
jgi:tRNA U34 5-carboxymethylaminomethyl modifying enzyme MnmG/GidA